MTKVVPVKMPDDLYERLQEVASRVGEADSTIIRLVLRAGLVQIEKDGYHVFRFSDDPGEKKAQGSAAFVESRSSRRMETTHSLNESPGEYKTKPLPR